MGHIPPKVKAPAPTGVDFHLGVAKESYAKGYLTLEEFEESVGHVLHGGHLSSSGRPVRSILRVTDGLKGLMYSELPKPAPKQTNRLQFPKPVMREVKK